jgi:hypothetical protein
LSKVKGKKDKDGCSLVTSVASMALVDVVEEDGQRSGQHVMVVVVLVEVVPRATDTFVVEQGVGGEAAEDLSNGIVHEAGQCVPLVGGLLHFICV